MKCPFCGCEELKVIDSRSVDDQNSIRRRRECLQCEKRFTTYEKIETVSFMVIKKDDMREPYDRSKAERGIMLACQKRPVSIEDIARLLDDLETTMFSIGAKEVSASKIGEFIMDRLKELDEVAYVRFASVYREFKDIETFTREINSLRKREE